MTVSVAYSADNDDFASDFDNDSEMEPTEDATLRPTTVGGCVFWWLVCTEFNSNWTHNYQIHKLHATLNMMMMIVIDTLLVGDVPQNCHLTGYMCSRY